MLAGCASGSPLEVVDKIDAFMSLAQLQEPALRGGLDRELLPARARYSRSPPPSNFMNLHVHQICARRNKRTQLRSGLSRS